MTRKVLEITNAFALVFIFVFGLSSVSMAATVMNGKEVKSYIGHIVSHNDRTGEIVIKTDRSTGNWRLSPHVGVFFGKERLELSEIWRNTREVKVFVSKDGEVQRINVLEWKK